MRRARRWKWKWNKLLFCISRSLKKTRLEKYTKENSKNQIGLCLLKKYAALVANLLKVATQRDRDIKATSLAIEKALSTSKTVF